MNFVRSNEWIEVAGFVVFSLSAGLCENSCFSPRLFSFLNAENTEKRHRRGTRSKKTSVCVFKVSDSNKVARCT